ncbi:MAG TPA: HAMP domain-containing sensor histidine kinase [Bradyrhizobium sp.]|nr:HAMP domain-containing sensor histidine kinase [Bradyrhizobium sp.]
MSHELGTPLNAIIGFSELLLVDGEREASKRAEFVRQILDAGRGLQSLIKDILDFSSFSNKVPLLRPTWTPIAPLLRSAVRAQSAASESKKVSVNVQPAELNFECFVDYDKFRQIISNLLGNAIKFTPAGGTIFISGTMMPEEGATVTLGDTGIGIASRDLSRVLEPFVQVENGQQGGRLGAGLGLPIAKQLTEAHGGQLFIESVLGQGTTVTVSLPQGSARRCEESR